MQPLIHGAAADGGPSGREAALADTPPATPGRRKACSTRGPARSPASACFVCLRRVCAAVLGQCSSQPGCAASGSLPLPRPFTPQPPTPTGSALLLHLRRRRQVHAALQVLRRGACMRDVMLALQQALPAKSGAGLPPSKRPSAMRARHVRHAAFRHAVFGARHHHVPQIPSLSSLLLPSPLPLSLPFPCPSLRMPSLFPLWLAQACVHAQSVRVCVSACPCVCVCVSWATPAGKRTKAMRVSCSRPDPSGGAGWLCRQGRRGLVDLPL